VKKERRFKKKLTRRMHEEDVRWREEGEEEEWY
jgi:hypothetical protein